MYTKTILDTNKDLKSEIENVYQGNSQQMIYKSKIPVKSRELKEMLGAIGDYNAFNPEFVGEVLARAYKNDQFYIAREYSVCIYIKLLDMKNREMAINTINLIGEIIQADEMDYYPSSNEIRFWWD